MEKEKEGEIHIFDFDGCIFPGYNEKGEHIMPQGWNIPESDLNIGKIKERMNGVRLVPEFIEFFNLLNRTVDDVKSYFVTGRKECTFGYETNDCLMDINIDEERDTIKFYPDDWPLTEVRYYRFKIYIISSIVFEDNNKSIIHIYDDNQHYYKNLHYLFDGVFNDVNFYVLQYDGVKDTLSKFWKRRIDLYENRNTR